MNQPEKLAFLKKLTDETVLTRRAMIERLGTPVLDLSDQVAAVIGTGGHQRRAGGDDREVQEPPRLHSL